MEISNSFAKLFSRIRIRNRLVKRALRKTNHLCGNTDSAFVEDIDGDLRDARSWCQIKRETRREEAWIRAWAERASEGAYLVSLADFADDVLLGYLDIVKAQQTSR